MVAATRGRKGELPARWTRWIVDEPWLQLAKKEFPNLSVSNDPQNVRRFFNYDFSSVFYLSNGAHSSWPNSRRCQGSSPFRRFKSRPEWTARIEAPGQTRATRFQKNLEWRSLISSFLRIVSGEIPFEVQPFDHSDSEIRLRRLNHLKNQLS